MMLEQATETIERLLDLQTPQAPQVSPNRTKVVYSTSYFLGHKKGDQSTSSIWIAETGKKASARQLTSGLFNDNSPKWCQGSDSVVFKSDRKEPGKKSGLYFLDLQGGEPVLLTDPEHERPIGKIAASPNGKFVAFLRAVEKTPEELHREKDKDDADYNRLYVLHLRTRAVDTLVKGDFHVDDIVWNADSSRIAFQTQSTPELEAVVHEQAELWQVEIATKQISKIASYKHAPRGGGLQWIDGKIWAVLNALPGNAQSSSVVGSVSDKGGEWSIELGGVDCCAGTIADGGNVLVAKIQKDLSDEIRLASGEILQEGICQYTDLCAVASSSDTTKPIVAFVRSTINAPLEVYSYSPGDESAIQLSSHGASITDDAAVTVPIHTQSLDKEVELDGILFLPKLKEVQLDSRKDHKPETPLRTFIYPHGGPYSRYTSYFMQGYGWPQILLRSGYAVFCPNYRGGSSHGQAFAGPHIVGKYDWIDMMTLTNHIVEAGYADKDNLIIGGWSQGGYLSYLAAVRNATGPGNLRFKGAIPGAGVSDWDTMASTSDLPHFETELAGGAPWNNEKDFKVSKTGSALWEFKKAADEKRIPPVLILHGRSDERTPVSQAWGFQRACRSRGLPCTMVVYPREGHAFKERRHIKDLFERVLKFCDLHFSS